MIPLKDDNPRARRPIITVSLIALNVVAFIYQIKLGFEPIIYSYGLFPADILNGKNLHTLLTSMFLHGGFLHLGGNMLYLWIFGDNVESYLGHVKYLIFYLLCGLIAVAAHIFLSGISNVPMIGASGAISGVLGGYLVKYPKAKVLVMIPIFWFLTFRKISALFVLGFWFVMQLFSGVISMGTSGSGVAFWAHVGGFVAGLILINLFSTRKRVVYYN